MAAMRDKTVIGTFSALARAIIQGLFSVPDRVWLAEQFGGKMKHRCSAAMLQKTGLIHSPSRLAGYQ